MLRVFVEHSHVDVSYAVDMFTYFVEGTCHYTKEEFLSFKM